MNHAQIGRIATFSFLLLTLPDTLALAAVTATWDAQLKRITVNCNSATGNSFSITKDGIGNVLILENGSIDVEILHNGYNVDKHVSEVEELVVNGSNSNDSFQCTQVTLANGWNSLNSCTLYGNGGSDYIHGTGFDDVIYGGNGDDIIYGGLGGDDIDGNAGEDNLRDYEPTDTIANVAALLITWDSGAGLYKIEAPANSTAVDVEIYTSNATSIGIKLGDYAIAFADPTIINKLEIHGTQNHDSIDCRPLVQTFQEFEIYGGAGNDHIYGTTGNDRLIGGSGDDYISGSGGNDKIGDILWVDGNLGDDSYVGTLITQPFKTIQRAADVATNESDILIKGNWTYHEQVALEGLVGTSDDPILVVGFGGTPTITGNSAGWPNNHETNLPSVHSSAFTHTRGLVEVMNCQYLTISNIRVTYSGQSGITVRNTQAAPLCKDVIVENCKVDRTRTYGILAIAQEAGGDNTTTTMIRDVTIRNNEISNACQAVTIPQAGGDSPNNSVDQAQGEALTVQKIDGFSVYGNRVKDFYKEGIDAKVECKNGEIYGNYIGHRNVDSPYLAVYGGGIYLDCARSAPGTYENIDVFRNVVIGNGQGIAVTCETGSTNTAAKDIRVYSNLVVSSGNPFAVPDHPGLQVDNLKVWNNTFVAAGPFGQVVANVRAPQLSQITGFDFRNNILAREVYSNTLLFNIEHNNPLSPANASSHGITIDSNVYWNWNPSTSSNHPVGTQGTNAITSDPGFVSETFSIAGENYTANYCISDYLTGTLVPSSAFQAGVTPPLVNGIQKVTEDIRGWSRPSGGVYDIGAFEFDYD